MVTGNNPVVPFIFNSFFVLSPNIISGCKRGTTRICVIESNSNFNREIERHNNNNVQRRYALIKT